MDIYEENNQGNSQGFDDENTRQEPAENTAPQQPQNDRPQNPYGSYHGAGAGQKESPYANSPYTNSPYQNSPYSGGYVPPRQNGSNTYHEAPRPQKPKKERHVGRTITAAVLTVALVGGSCFATGTIVDRKWEDRNAETISQLNDKISDLQQQINENASAASTEAPVTSGTQVSGSTSLTPGQVYANNVNSVVAISSKVTATDNFGRTTEGTSSGSGFIISSDGYIVTNHHVIENASEITVSTYSGDSYTATLIGSDSVNDVAVLKVDATDLPAVTLGSSDSLAIGDMVVAIGNPLGTLAATQTVGYVSGKNREVSTDSAVINMIQTDAAINPGNSGGPLFNMKGEVVGITTAKYSGTTSSGASIEGIGFAIPIDDISGIISDLSTLGYVTGAYLGVTVRNMDSEAASYYGLPMGAYVDSVVSGGSADRAGVQAKDIITQLGDYTVSSTTELTRALRHFKGGDETTIVVYRSGKELTLSISLDEKPHSDTSDSDGATEETVPGEGSYEDWYNYFKKFFGGQDSQNGNG